MIYLPEDIASESTYGTVWCGRVRHAVFVVDVAALEGGQRGGGGQAHHFRTTALAMGGLPHHHGPLGLALPSLHQADNIPLEKFLAALVQIPIFAHFGHFFIDGGYEPLHLQAVRYSPYDAGLSGILTGISEQWANAIGVTNGVVHKRGPEMGIIVVFAEVDGPIEVVGLQEHQWQGILSVSGALQEVHGVVEQPVVLAHCQGLVQIVLGATFQKIHEFLLFFVFGQ